VVRGLLAARIANPSFGGFNPLQVRADKRQDAGKTVGTAVVMPAFYGLAKAALMSTDQQQLVVEAIGRCYFVFLFDDAATFAEGGLSAFIHHFQLGIAFLDQSVTAAHRLPGQGNECQ